MQDQRFTDPGSSLYELATHFVVHCPQCQGKATVHPDQRLTCSACFHVEKPGHWYGSMTAFVAVKCRECHAPIRRSAPSDGVWKKLATRCEQCGDTCEYEAQLSRHPMNRGQITDPVYGLPLWLQKTFRDEIFWAYNYDHLELLQAYIGAKLRERGNQPIKNRSMVSRLPGYIKKAANRAALLQLIAQLWTKTA